MGESRVRSFEPIRVGGIEAANRLWMAPMCQYRAVDGVIGPWQSVHLGAVASGGIGLVLTEATAVAPEGRITPRCAGIWSDEQADEWRHVVDVTHDLGVPIIAQLAHAGRKASAREPLAGRGWVPHDEGGWSTVGPSALGSAGMPAPDALDTAGLAGVVDAFVAATRRAIDAGFDGVEVHAAHGYLLHSFCSPLSNHRDDAYGGSFEGRARLLLDVVAAVRAILPDRMALLVRISAEDWLPGGWTIDDSVRLAPLLEARGADFIDVSSGGLDRGQRIEVGPGYQVPLARRVREAVSVPVGAVGLITTPQQAEGVLVDGAADVVLLGRQLLRDPRFALRAAAELGAELTWPPMLAMGKYAGSIP